MFFRKLPLGLYLFLLGLVAVAVGAVMGLGVTYVKQARLRQVEVEAHFVDAVSNFAAKLDSGFLKKLKAEDVASRGAFADALDTFFFLKGGNGKVSAQVLNPSDNGL